jgi:hypothetical protein
MSRTPCIITLTRPYSSEYGHSVHLVDVTIPCRGVGLSRDSPGLGGGRPRPPHRRGSPSKRILTPDGQRDGLLCIAWRPTKEGRPIDDRHTPPLQLCSLYERYVHDLDRDDVLWRLDARGYFACEFRGRAHLSAGICHEPAGRASSRQQNRANGQAVSAKDPPPQSITLRTSK